MAFFESLRESNDAVIPQQKNQPVLKAHDHDHLHSLFWEKFQNNDEVFYKIGCHDFVITQENLVVLERWIHECEHEGTSNPEHFSCIMYGLKYNKEQDRVTHEKTITFNNDWTYQLAFYIGNDIKPESKVASCSVSEFLYQYSYMMAQKTTHQKEFNRPAKSLVQFR